MRRRNPGAWGRPRRRRLDPAATADERANDADQFEEQLIDWHINGVVQVEDEDEEDEDVEEG